MFAGVQENFRQMGAEVKFIEDKKPTPDEITRATKRRVLFGTRTPINRLVKNVVQDAIRPLFNIDIKGGRFEIKSTKDSDIQVLDLDKAGRHLLLMANKNRFLCGHDERQWFTCAVPGNPKNVFEAKQSLKPKDILEVEKGIRPKHANKRHLRLGSIGSRHRQGEFFFTPRPDLHFEQQKLNTILKKERIGQGGHPHVADELVRPKGRQVWIYGDRILNDKDYEALNDSQQKLCRR